MAGKSGAIDLIGGYRADLEIIIQQGPSYKDYVESKRDVFCKIEVENYTNYHLKDNDYQANTGEVSLLPVDIALGTSEVMVFQKEEGSEYGTSGTISWDVKGSGRRLIVMWDCPFQFKTNTNWFGVGTIDSSFPYLKTGGTFYTEMYKNVIWNKEAKQSWRQKSASGIDFESEPFYKKITPITFEDRDFTVIATMSDAHKATAKIKIYPNLLSNYAPAMREKLTSLGLTTK